MAPLAFEFFFRLLWGWSFFLLFISRSESSEGFLKVSARFSLGYGLVALLSAYFSQSSEPVGGQSVAVICLLIFASFAYLSLKHVALRLLAVGIILFAPLLLLGQRAGVPFLNAAISAMALGGAFMGQFLGHWYLNVPNIHIREFKRITKLMLGALVLRSLWVLGVLFFFNFPSELSTGEFFSLRGDYAFGLGAFGLILLSSRVLWGLVAPGILTFMAKKTVDMRSTQSATGIFYANSVLMLLGELCALYLERELKWPI